MNKKGLFLMGLAAMAFASCSNDDLLSDGSGTTQPTVAGEGEPTYVTFSLNVNNGSVTRADSDGNHKFGIENTKVDSAYLFIFNESSKVLENKFEVHPKDGQTRFTELVTAGKKKIYAIANPTSAMYTQIAKMSPKSPDSTLDQFLLLKFEAGTSDDIKTLVPSTPMPMSSIDSPNVYNLDAGISADSAAVGGNNHLNLELKRMVARTSLLVGESAKFASGKAGIVEGETKYTIRNQSIKTYLIQNKGTGIVKSPTYDYTIENYKSGFDTDFFKDGQITAAYKDTLYVTENTSYSFLKGAAPYIILHSRYVPDKIVTAAEFNVGTQTVKLTYENTTESEEVKKMVVSAESSDEKIIANGVCFKDSLIFKDAVLAAQKQSVGFFISKIDYSNGSFYRINLGQTNKESDGTSTTTYGTERNKSYRVKVNSVTGPGWNTPDDADEEETDPVDQKTYVDVTISVAPWEEVDQDVDLN